MSIGMSESACLSMVVGVLSVLSISSLFLSLCYSLSMSSSLLSIRKGKSHNYLVGRGSSDYGLYAPSVALSLSRENCQTLYRLALKHPWVWLRM